MPALTPEQEALKQAAQLAHENDFALGTSLTPEFFAFVDKATPAAILALLAQLEPVQAVPDILFDGMAVYEEITRKLGKGHCISAEAVSATLDAVVRLIRAAKAVPGESGQ